MGLSIRWRRRVNATTSLVVWLTAAVACLLLIHNQETRRGAIRGVASADSISVTHLELGRISRLHVGLHDSVKAGQILIHLDDASAREALGRAELDVTQMKSEVEELRKRVTWENEREERIGTQQLQDMDSENRERLDLLRRYSIDRERAQLEHINLLTNLARDRMLLQGAMVRLESARKLAEEGVESSLSLSDANTEVNALNALIDKSEEGVSAAKSHFEAADQRYFKQRDFADEIRAFQAPTLDPEGQLGSLRVAIDSKHLEIESLVRRIDAHVLRASIDGQVTEVFAKEGETFLAGEPILSINATSSNRLIAYIPQDRDSEFRAGDRVRVARGLPGDNNSTFGTVDSLSSRIVEAPLRHRPISSVPLWGRPVVVVLENDAYFSPGEELWIQGL